MSVLGEFKRRKIVQVTAVYLLIGKGVRFIYFSRK